MNPEEEKIVWDRKLFWKVMKWVGIFLFSFYLILLLLSYFGPKFQEYLIKKSLSQCLETYTEDSVSEISIKMSLTPEILCKRGYELTKFVVLFKQNQEEVMEKYAKEYPDLKNSDLEEKMEKEWYNSVREDILADVGKF